jgi:hypothetical protein
MPEPTITRTQEWQRISLKLIVEGSYEKITRAELKFITLTYDRTNEEINSLFNLIKLHAISVIENMINKNDERLNIYNRIKALIKLYSAIILLISMPTITDVDSQSIQRIINSSLNKIPEIKLKISRRLSESDPEVMQLYNIFDMFIDIAHE